MTCDQLFGRGTNRRPIDRDRFDRLVSGREIVRSWLRRAWRQRNASPTDCFEPFIFTWIAFNGWGESVTGEESDRGWLRQVSSDIELVRAFAAQVSAGAEVGRAVADFQRHWPIPKAQDLRARQFSVPYSTPWQETASLYTEHTVAHEPGCAAFHADLDEEIPNDWRHFLAALYRVRCNLFHGEKDPYYIPDQEVVHAGMLALLHFLVATDCFGDFQDEHFSREL